LMSAPQLSVRPFKPHGLSVKLTRHRAFLANNAETPKY
jgi:hypothetical protein